MQYLNPNLPRWTGKGPLRLNEFCQRVLSCGNIGTFLPEKIKLYRDSLLLTPSFMGIHTLLYKKKFYKKFSLKTPKTLKYLKKSPASNAWAAILKNDEISSIKVIKWFSIFYLKFLTVLLINGSSILFTKHGKIKRRKLWDVYPC